MATGLHYRQQYDDKYICNCNYRANSLMKQIHNSKERMPTILPGDLAEAWLYKDLSDQEIVDIGNYQVSSVDMKAWPLHKDFLKRENPLEEVIYNEVPKLVMA